MNPKPRWALLSPRKKKLSRKQICLCNWINFYLLFPEFHSRSHLSLRQPRAPRGRLLLAWFFPSVAPAVSSFCTTTLSRVCHCLASLVCLLSHWSFSLLSLVHSRSGFVPSSMTIIENYLSHKLCCHLCKKNLKRGALIPGTPIICSVKKCQLNGDI